MAEAYVSAHSGSGLCVDSIGSDRPNHGRHPDDEEDDRQDRHAENDATTLALVEQAVLSVIGSLIPTPISLRSLFHLLAPILASNIW